MIGLATIKLRKALRSCKPNFFVEQRDPTIKKWGALIKMLGTPLKRDTMLM